MAQSADQKPNFYLFNFGIWGRRSMPVGIDRRIRQGMDGPNTIEPGADIMGVYETPRQIPVSVGDHVVMEHKSKRWNVEVTYASDPRNKEIVQDVPGFYGLYVQGVIVSVYNPENNS